MHTPHAYLKSQCLIKQDDNFALTGHKLATFHLLTDSGTKISLKVDLMNTANEPHYQRPLFDSHTHYRVLCSGTPAYAQKTFPSVCYGDGKSARNGSKYIQTC
jgi:hypothetical protein